MVPYFAQSRQEDQYLTNLTNLTNYQLASFPQRSLASLIDLAITSFISVDTLVWWRGIFTSDQNSLLFGTLIIIYVVPIVYYHLTIALWSNPVGKLILGLMVLKTSGALPTFLTAALRYSINSLTLLLLFFFSTEISGMPIRQFDQSGLLSFVSALCAIPMLIMVSVEGFLALFSPQRQTLHDELAGTIVVKVVKVVKAKSLAHYEQTK